jgi:hypothetical protein
MLWFNFQSIQDGREIRGNGTAFTFSDDTATPIDQCRAGTPGHSAPKLCAKQPLALLAGQSQIEYDSYTFRIFGSAMGIVKIGDELHEEVRKASSVMVRSINAQAEYWIKIGMLAEANPGMSFSQIMREQMKHADVDIRNIAGG